MLLFKTLALAMSIPIPKLIVIEEPEYALAPLQQIVLSEIYWSVSKQSQGAGPHHVHDFSYTLAVHSARCGECKGLLLHVLAKGEKIRG
jgi:predicted ATPase